MTINPGCGMEKMEKNMKAKECMKHAVAPIFAMILLPAFFRQVCTQNGQYNYLMLYFLARIPFGRGYLFIAVILKGYDTGGITEIMLLDMVMAGVTGGSILTFRWLMATGYPAGAMTADIARMAKLTAEKDRTR